MRSSIRSLLTAALLIAVVGGLGCVAYVPPQSSPYPRVTGAAAVFYHDLAPYGDWLWLEAHGWVWTPANRPPGWRPYTAGRWARTLHGWTWVSAWSWGWAPFHYGRWLWSDDLGWVWIPGTEWAPAWVAWRYGPDWIGWAPLPPWATWRIGVGFDLGNVVIDIGWWSYVRSVHFVDVDLRRRIVAVDRHRELARVTRPVTRYEREERGVVERSVPFDEVQRRTDTPIPQLRIDDLKRPPRPRAEPIDGDRLRVYRPPSPDSSRRPATGSTGRAQTGGEKRKSDPGKPDAGRTRPPKPRDPGRAIRSVP